jgi:translation initiation factor 2 subunit 1
VLTSVEGNKHNADVSITYLGAPKYRLVISAENFKVAEKALNSILQSVQKGIEKKGGTFKFTREESRKGVT